MGIDQSVDSSREQPSPLYIVWEITKIYVCPSCGQTNKMGQAYIFCVPQTVKKSLLQKDQPIKTSISIVMRDFYGLNIITVHCVVDIFF